MGILNGDEHAFEIYVNSQLLRIMDAAERASDGVEREHLTPSDLAYALKQAERASGSCIMLIRMIRVAQMMFDGKSRAQAWKMCSPALPMMTDESDALASLNEHIKYWISQN